MKSSKSGWRPALVGLGLFGLAGCEEDNEAAIKAQAANARNTIPGSRTAQAQTPEEYHEITPGIRGAGTRGAGPRPDQGAGYPDANSATAASSLSRMAMPSAGRGSGHPVGKQ